MGRHRKPTDTINLKKIALGMSLGLGAAVVPATFAGPASAASGEAWERIAACESGDMNVLGSAQWNRPDGHADSSGGLQIQLRTWNDYGGQEFASAPHLATKAQQIAVAERILASQGPGAWVCNSPGHGVASGALSGQTADPDPDPTPTVPTPDPDPTTPTPDPDPTPTVPAPGDVDEDDPAEWYDRGIYIVQPGDTLSEIAYKLDTKGGWKALYELNKDVIGDDPNLIEPGQGLLMYKVNPDPYKDGLPKVGQKSPSAKALQTELKRVGIMDKDVELADNYGPLTRAGVQKFHDAHPQFSDGTADGDRQIGPEGWAHLRVMKDNAPHGAPSTPAPADDDDLPGAIPGDSHPSAGGYVMPVSGSIGQSLIVGSGGSMSRSAGGHSGLDISAPSGTPVKSVAAGTVVSINASGAAYGNHVVVKHADGKYTLYAHMSSISVGMGQSVGAGTQVGTVGSTGFSSGPHLHFEVRTDPTAFNSGVFLEPKAYLRANGVSI